jgi:hypothetical protein
MAVIVFNCHKRVNPFWQAPARNNSTKAFACLTYNLVNSWCVVADRKLIHWGCGRVEPALSDNIPPKTALDWVPGRSAAGAVGYFRLLSSR